MTVAAALVLLRKARTMLDHAIRELAGQRQRKYIVKAHDLIPGIEALGRRMDARERRRRARR